MPARMGGLSPICFVFNHLHLGVVPLVTSSSAFCLPSPLSVAQRGKGLMNMDEALVPSKGPSLVGMKVNFKSLQHLRKDLKISLHLSETGRRGKSEMIHP